jgi:hypothetical protein
VRNISWKLLTVLGLVLVIPAVQPLAPAGASSSSLALVPTGASTLDVVGGVDSTRPSGDSALPLNFTATQLSNDDEPAGTAVSPDGTVGLVATLDNFIDVINDPGPGAPVTPVDVSGLASVTDTTIETSGVAITPDGSQGLVAVGGDGVGILAPSGDSYALHVNGSIFAPSPTQTGTYDGVVISPTKGADGHYVALLMDASHSTVGVVTGVGTVSPQFVGTVTNPSIQDTGTIGYQGTDDFGTGGMAFSPTTATKAVVVTVDGVSALSLDNPAAPALTTAVTVPGASPSGAQSVVVAPDGNHVVFAVNNTLYFYTGLQTAAPDDPLSPSAAPLVMPGFINSLGVSANGYLVVNYNVGSSGAAVGTIGGMESATPSFLASASLNVSGQAPDINGMSVWPAEIASSAPSPGTASSGGSSSKSSTSTTLSGSSGTGKKSSSPTKSSSSTTTSKGNGSPQGSQHACPTSSTTAIPYQDLFWDLFPSARILSASRCRP